MNKAVQSTIGISVAGLLVLLATNGKDLVEAMHAAWLFLLALSATAPLGLSSVALAVALSVAVQIVVRRHWPVKCAASKSAGVDAIGILVGGVAVWVQLPTPFGMLLALLAGFMAPSVSRGVVAAFEAGRRVFSRYFGDVE